MGDDHRPVAPSYRLTVRDGPRVQRQRFDTLDAALDELERRVRQLALRPPRAPVDLRVRRFEPAAQVAARAEVAGGGSLLRRGVRGGVDLRGDGSVEAYVGGAGRRLLDQAEGESAYDALRRALAG